MKTFLKTRIKDSLGGQDAYIALDDIVMFSANDNSNNTTIVTKNKCYTAIINFSEMEEIVKKNYKIIKSC